MTNLTNAEAYRLNRAGQSYAQIGRAYGLTRGQVAGMVNRAKEEMTRGGEAVAAGRVSEPGINDDGETPRGEKVELREDANTAEAESTSTRITTLAGLIAACHVDLEAWTVERYVVNKWEVGAKDALGNIVIEPLFQVKAWLARKKPEAVKPVIQPVMINIGERKAARPEKRAGGLKTALVIPDTQFGFSRDVLRGKLTPFHDRRALGVVLAIARVLMPDISVFLGDVNDFSGWSDKYIRSPEFFFTTQPALIEAAWYIGQIRKVTRGDVYDLEGNHDVRPEKQIVTHLVDAYGLRSADNLDAAPVMSVDNLLGLSRMGVKYVSGYPDGEVWINETTRCIHGEKARNQPGLTASAIVRESDTSVIYGHIHKYELATRTVREKDGDRYITAYSPGCLCHIDGRVPGSSRANNWQQGAAVIWYNDERADIEHIAIQNGQAVFRGELYAGEDYVDELKQETGWDF